MSPKKVSVLVVDDDTHMLRMMRHILGLEGYRVFTASSGEAALDIFDDETPDLVLLDIIMPNMNGYAACQRIREFSQVPIIIVTVKDNDEERIAGLDAGADDYITKPFSSKELAARVRAILRRNKLGDEHPEPTFRSEGLVVDFARRRVSLGGQEINLTATEYRVLSYLARNTNRVITPNQILEKVWGEEYVGDTHLLQVNIARLRKKLEDEGGGSKYILTRPGIGYMMPKKM